MVAAGQYPGGENQELRNGVIDVVNKPLLPNLSPWRRTFVANISSGVYPYNRSVH